jgi:regulator of sigma E protease
MSILLVVLGLILFVALVVVHEFGHFIAARRSGVEVEEFGIGFPPKAKTLAVRKGTEYTINWLPLGGFVRLKGEHDSATEPGTYGAAPLKSKLVIMLAGVVMNLVTAFVVLTLLALVGIPKLIDNQFSVPSDSRVVSSKLLVAYVEPESPAAKAGIEQKDVIVGYYDPFFQMSELKSEGEKGGYAPLASADELLGVTKRYAGQTVEFVFSHEGTEQQKHVTLRGEAEVRDSESNGVKKGYLGVSPAEYTLERSTWSAPVVAAGLIKQMTELTFKALGGMVANLARGDTAKATEQVAGPIGIFALIKNGSFLGLEFILMIIAIISLTLAIMNVLPIPALDGGRFFVTLLFRAIRKPLTRQTEERIHGTGFALLMILFILITIVDIRRFF